MDGEGVGRDRSRDVALRRLELQALGVSAVGVIVAGVAGYFSFSASEWMSGIALSIYILARGYVLLRRGVLDESIYRLLILALMITVAVLTFCGFGRQGFAQLILLGLDFVLIHRA